MDTDMDMRELEAFAAVVEEGSFTKAAQALFLSQPTISAHIASLEKKLQIRLLIRANRSVYPSEAGKLLYGYVKEILALRSAAAAAMESFSQEMRGLIRIAASPTPGYYVLPPLLELFARDYPEIRFELSILESPEVAAQVAAQKVDLGFTGTVATRSGCLYSCVAEDRFLLVAPDRPAYHAGPPARFLSREAFVLRESGSAARMESEHFLRALGLHIRDLKIAAVASSAKEQLELVSQGLGVAVVPRCAYLFHKEEGKLCSFSFDSVRLRQKIYLVQHRGSPLSPIVESFVEKLKELCGPTLTPNA